MILWMLWSVLFSACLGFAALALERAAGFFAAPKRFVWMFGIVAAVVVPVVFATRIAPEQITLVQEFMPTPRTGVSPMVRVSSPTVTPISPVERSVFRATMLTADADVWAMRLWAVMSLMVLGVFARAADNLRRRRAAWRETTLGACEALVAADAGPAVVGFARPRIVIPEWVLGVERRTQDMMLQHEVEHIRAGDPQALFAAGFTLAVFPWNAVLWWMVRRLRLAVELDCDARVIRTIGESHDYGMVLLAVGERHSVPLPMTASLAWPRPFLERRITAMTMIRPRRPLLASLPLAALAIVVMTAATSAPRPRPLGAIAMMREAKPFPTREDIHEVVGTFFPKIADGSDKVNCLILVYDSDNNFVRGIPAMRGLGSVMIEVDGDTLKTNLERRQRSALRTGIPMNPHEGGPPGEGGSGGGGRGGRGGGSATSGDGSAATIVAQGTLSSPGNVSPTNYVTFYSQGWTSMSMDSTRAGVHPSLNNALGLTTPVKGGASGIDGIQASQLASIESMSFGPGQLAPASVQVLAVFLVPPTKKPVQ